MSQGSPPPFYFVVSRHGPKCTGVPDPPLHDAFIEPEEAEKLGNVTMPNKMLKASREGKEAMLEHLKEQLKVTEDAQIKGGELLPNAHKGHEALGKFMAQLLATAGSHEKKIQILHSPYARTQQTAEQISKGLMEHTGLKINVELQSCALLAETRKDGTNESAYGKTTADSIASNWKNSKTPEERRLRFEKWISATEDTVDLFKKIGLKFDRKDFLGFEMQDDVAVNSGGKLISDLKAVAKVAQAFYNERCAVPSYTAALKEAKDDDDMPDYACLAHASQQKLLNQAAQQEQASLVLEQDDASKPNPKLGHERFTTTPFNVNEQDLEKDLDERIQRGYYASEQFFEQFHTDENFKLIGVPFLILLLRSLEINCSRRTEDNTSSGIKNYMNTETGCEGLDPATSSLAGSSLPAAKRNLVACVSHDVVVSFVRKALQKSWSRAVPLYRENYFYTGCAVSDPVNKDPKKLRLPAGGIVGEAVYWNQLPYSVSIILEVKDQKVTCYALVPTLTETRNNFETREEQGQQSSDDKKTTGPLLRTPIKGCADIPFAAFRNGLASVVLEHLTSLEEAGKQLPGIEFEKAKKWLLMSKQE
ncbi:unnamed protein product [Amoebophrya sp. A25]|nr:unnamed protein product [Amoebophrya sp. A25]|eukprot:GSA25T00020369001.1